MPKCPRHGIWYGGLVCPMCSSKIGKKGEVMSLMLLMVVISVFSMIYYAHKSAKLETELESIKRQTMQKDIPRTNFTNGFYLSEKYYCVWTNGRSEKEIEKTECHEQCHWLVDKKRINNQYAHFCGG